VADASSRRLPDAAELAQTARSIVAMQEPTGAIPFTPGAHTDIWNHVEAAMALMAGGEVAAAERAYEWVLATQRADGSWPMRFVANTVTDASTDTNASAYLAVGVWQHWLVRHDREFVRRCWPAVRRGLDLVVSLQLPFGGIAWSGERPLEALLAGSSSIYQSLRAGASLAALMGDPQPEWELAGGRLGHAIRAHESEFLDKRQFSMDWYYPILGGALRDPAPARARLELDWDRFVRPGLGIVCVDTNPWVTGAETCELAMTLVALGNKQRAETLIADMGHLRLPDGSYWTGVVYPEMVNWPVEQTTYTAAAVILAVDAVRNLTPGADIMTGTSKVSPFAEFGLECGCESVDRVPGVARHTP
jgi:hypothetical protein